MNIFLCIFFLLVMSCHGDEDIEPDMSDPDTSDWVDPTDMLNYDPGSQTMKHSTVKLNKDKQNIQEMPESQSGNLPKCALVECNDHKLKECEKSKSQIQNLYTKIKKSTEDRPQSEQPYFKQYARQLVGYFDKYEIPDGSSSTFHIEVELTVADLMTLNKFANSEYGNLQDAHDILTHMVKQVILTQGYTPPSWNDMIAETIGGSTNVLLLSMSVTSLCLVIYVQLRYRFSWMRCLLTLLITLFLISVPWNWWHMYKMVVAKRQAEALKDIPAACRPQDQTVGQTLLMGLKAAFTFSADECAQYHEAMLVDPMLEVPPTKALAVTVTRFLLEPLEHIGGAIGRLIRNTLQDLPVHLWPFALAFIVFTTFLILIMACGYKTKFFYIFGLEPGESRRKRSPSEMQLKGRIQELTHEVERLKIKQETSEAQVIPEAIQYKPLIQETPLTSKDIIEEPVVSSSVIRQEVEVPGVVDVKLAETQKIGAGDQVGKQSTIEPELVKSASGMTLQRIAHSNPLKNDPSIDTGDEPENQAIKASMEGSAFEELDIPRPSQESSDSDIEILYSHVDKNLSLD